jgi:hypothetical protein
MRSLPIRLVAIPWLSCVAATIDYRTQVHPILATRCLACHSQEKRSGGLSLANLDDALEGGRSGAAIKPGRSADSIVMARLNDPAATRMPLGGPPLAPNHIATIRTWIDEGARATPTSAPARPRWEPPLALSKPAVPPPTWPAWSRPLDRLASRYLARNRVPDPGAVSDAVFARRAYLDIHGLLPEPDQLREFESDAAPDKRARLVERLLADNRRYAEHWISFWNDLLRNEEGVSYYSETASRRSITPWLLPALESNLPFHRWIQQLLNPTDPADPDGFLVGVNWRGTVSASQTPALQAAQNTAQIFLGVNLKCNSCHDSFISRWKLKDAYSLAAFFSAEEQLRLYRCDAEQDEQARASFLFPELNRPIASDSVGHRRAAAVAIFTDPRNGRMPRTIANRVWQRLMGRGIVENVDEMDGEPWSPELLDWLAAEFVDGGFDLKRLISTIVESRAYQLPTVARRGPQPKQYTFRGPEVRRLTAEQFADAVAAITGDWRVAPAVAPAAARPPAIVSGVPSSGAGVVARVAAPRSTPAPAPAAPPPPIPPGTYSREWRLAGTSFTRALGRPIRDQVFSTRDTQATAIQAVELVNGELLTHWVWRGARKMLGQLPPEPTALFGRQATTGRGAVPFDVDISGARELHLIVQDALSTAADKATAQWMDSELIGPAGSVRLSSLVPADASGLREGSGPAAVKVRFPSALKYDIAGRGFARMRGSVGYEVNQLGQGEAVNGRFFIFDQQPDLDRLVPPKPETPLPARPVLSNVSATVDRVYRYALGRAPTPTERKLAEAAIDKAGKPSAEGLADLLWAVLMTPEFQLVR